jgi:hypothetical protein
MLGIQEIRSRTQTKLREIIWHRRSGILRMWSGIVMFKQLFHWISRAELVPTPPVKT